MKSPSPPLCTPPQAPFPAVFISSPSAKDPRWQQRHRGKAAALVLAPAFYQPFAKWANQKPRNRDADYQVRTPVCLSSAKWANQK